MEAEQPCALDQHPLVFGSFKPLVPWGKGHPWRVPERASIQLMLPCRRWAQTGLMERKERRDGLTKETFSGPRRKHFKEERKKRRLLFRVFQDQNTLIIKKLKCGFFFPPSKLCVFSCRNSWQLYKLTQNIFSLHFSMGKNSRQNQAAPLGWADCGSRSAEGGAEP